MTFTVVTSSTKYIVADKDGHPFYIKEMLAYPVWIDDIDEAMRFEYSKAAVLVTHFNDQEHPPRKTPRFMVIAVNDYKGESEDPNVAYDRAMRGI